MVKNNILDIVGHRKRAREKFEACKGVGTADYELLELLLFYTIPRRDVKPVAKELLRRFGSLAEVLYAPRDELASVDFVGKNTIHLFNLIVETNIRICKEKLCESDMPILANMDALIDYCRASLAYREVEELHILYLDAAFHLKGSETISRGSLTGVRISIEEIIRKTKEKRVPNIILVHNHPSGFTKPSTHDIEITKELFVACRYMNIALQEHLIVSPFEYFSFRSEGYLI